MRDFAYLFNAKAQFGCKPWNLKFDHPGWVKFQNAVPADATVALVDNTTLHQALIVMREGLGQAESNYAVLLPDLTTLFFAYAYFDRVVVLDKGFNGRRASGPCRCTPRSYGDPLDRSCVFTRRGGEAAR
jgi:hypothetical protein